MWSRSGVTEDNKRQPTITLWLLFLFVGEQIGTSDLYAEVAAVILFPSHHTLQNTI